MTEKFTVVVHEQGQHSLWSEEREPPVGWQRSGPVRSREQCLESVGRSWHELRSRSLVSPIDSAGTPGA